MSSATRAFADVLITWGSDAPAVFALGPGPQRLGQQNVDRCDHLVAQLPHAKGHDRRLELDVGRGAEHLAQAAVHPAVEDHSHPRTRRQALRDVPQDRLVYLVVGPPGRSFDDGPLGFVEAAANTCAKVDRIRDCRSEPSFVMSVGGPKVEDVERMARAERELDIDAAHLGCESAVFMLRIDDEDLDSSTERAHSQRGEEVCLAGAGVSEDRYVGVCISNLVEGIYQGAVRVGTLRRHGSMERE